MIPKFNDKMVMLEDKCILCKEPILKSPDDKEPMCNGHEFIDEIKVAINQAKRGVYNLVITKIRERMNEQIKFRANYQVNSPEWDETFFRADELKKLWDDLERHLSTSAKQKEHNSS